MTRDEASSPWPVILVRYGEIGIKSPSVRRRFENRLRANMEAAFAEHGVEAQVARVRGRFFAHVRDEAAAIRVLTRTFGVVSVSPVSEVPPTIPAIGAAVAASARDALREGQSFAVRVRRTGSHPFTSMEAGREAGSAVMLDPDVADVRVNLTDPDVEFHVEVRDENAYVYRDKVPGPGGLPVGTQGRVAAIVEDARGALAAWLLMKRGCTVQLVAVDDRDVASFLDALRDWTPRFHAITLPVPDAVAGDPATRRVFLLKAAGAHVQSRRGHAVVTGDGLAGAVATSHLDAAARLPVFRPLTGFSGDALRDLAATAGLAAEPEPAEVATLPDAAADDVAEVVRDALRASRPVEVPAP